MTSCIVRFVCDAQSKHATATPWNHLVDIWDACGCDYRQPDFRHINAPAISCRFLHGPAWPGSVPDAGMVSGVHTTRQAPPGDLITSAVCVVPLRSVYVADDTLSRWVKRRTRLIASVKSSRR